MSDVKEIRRVLYTKDAKFAVSKPEADKPTTVEGYAVVWNTLSSDRGYYKVRFKPGSAVFAAPSHAFFHHDPRLILASTGNGSLRLSQDNIGVKFEITLPNTTLGRDVAEMVRTQLVGGMSFSQLYDDQLIETRLTEDETEIIEISRFTMDEVTVTATPAFSQTSIQIKKEDEEDGEFSRKESMRLEWAKLERLRLDLID